jgi:AcrR family transcriptional regulator
VSEPAARRRLSADDRRAEISSAARSLFATNGYHATTTRELARAAGVSDALLYRHFGSKQELLDHVITEAIETFGTLPPLERMAGLPTDQLLTNLGKGFLGRITANLDLIMILIGEHANVQDARFATFIDRAATALGEDLARRRVSRSPDDGYFAARTFFGSLISFVLLQRVLGMDTVRPTDAEGYLDHLVAHTIEGART